MRSRINQPINILMIDNYDSFTFNLVHYLEGLGLTVQVKKNDEMTQEQVAELAPSHIILSPGPCTPNEAGICLELVKNFQGKIPILGVCLGHQVIAQSFGAKIVAAAKIMHGKMSSIQHSNVGVFEGLPQGFAAIRYHSLVIEPESLPDAFEITAWSTDSNGEFESIMAIKHKTLAIEGIQFHPESVLSEFGHEILAKFAAVSNLNERSR